MHSIWHHVYVYRLSVHTIQDSHPHSNVAAATQKTTSSLFIRNAICCILYSTSVTIFFLVLKLVATALTYSLSHCAHNDTHTLHSCIACQLSHITTVLLFEDVSGIAVAGC
jgi:hypothetical protein